MFICAINQIRLITSCTFIFLCNGNSWRKYYFLPLYYTHSIDPKEDLERDERKRLKGQYIEVMDVNHFILILLLVYRINTNIFFIL